MRSSNPRIDGSRFNLPLSSNATSIIKENSGPKVNPKQMTNCLFPSPLTCASIEDMAFMDEDSQNMVSAENEHHYQEIGKLWIFCAREYDQGFNYRMQVCNFKL